MSIGYNDTQNAEKNQTPDTGSGLLQKPAKEKLLYFEGLRGLLALVVFIHHFILLFYPVIYVGSFNYQDFLVNPWSFNILLAHSPLNIFMSGHLAVCLFLVISGYVLTYSYRNSNNFVTLQRNSLKRYIRLVLPVLVTCLVIKILYAGGIITGANYPRNVEKLEFGGKLFTSEYPLWAVLKTALLSVPLSGSNGFLPVLWTIQIEFLGALVLFAFLMTTHKLDGKIYYALIILLGTFYFSYYYFPVLLAGGVICLYEEKIQTFFRSALSKFVLLIAGLFLGGMLNTEKEAIAETMYSFTLIFPFNVYPYFHDLSAILLFILLITSRKLKFIFSQNLIVRFGKLCFSIYLLHLPVLYCLGSYLMWTSRGKIHPLTLFVACFGATLLIAIPFYKYVDKVSIRLSNAFAGKIIG